MSLSRRAVNVPGPFVWPTSKEWDGNDGSWSTFYVNVGGQNFRILPSTLGTETWVPLPDGCPADAPTDCPARRGVALLNNAQSEGYTPGVNSTEIGSYLLKVNDVDYLGNNDTGQLYLDTVGPGKVSDSLDQLERQPVYGIKTTDYFLGLFGLGIAPISFTSQSVSPWLKSYNSTETPSIPSVSYGYTAGAAYKEPSRFGSLVLGGYDKSRIRSGVLSLQYDIQQNYSLPVHIKSITISGSESTAITAKWPSGFWADIDSSLPYIWLPRTICDEFESSLGLTYDSTTDHYIVNSSARAQNLAGVDAITITLDDEPGSPNITSITFPYSAFDLQASWPIYNNATYYFPIRRSPNGLFVLGRTFLQEAYLFVDHERKTFNVTPAAFPDVNASPEPVPVQHQYYKTGSSGLSKGAIAGIAVGAALFVFAVLAIVAWLFLRNKKRNQQKKKEEAMVYEMQNFPPKDQNELPSPTITAVNSPNRPRHHRGMSDVSHGSYELESPPQRQSGGTWKTDTDRLDYFAQNPTFETVEETIQELEGHPVIPELASDPSPRALSSDRPRLNQRQSNRSSRRPSLAVSERSFMRSSQRISENVSEAGFSAPSDRGSVVISDPGSPPSPHEGAASDLFATIRGARRLSRDESSDGGNNDSEPGERRPSPGSPRYG